MGEPKPWERQRGEGDRAFHAFGIYRDLGVDRSIDLVAGQLRDAKGSQRGPKVRSCGHYGRLARKWQWRARVTAWDEYVDKERRKEFLVEIKRMGKRQAQQAELMSIVLTEPARVFLKKIQVQKDLLDAMTVKDLLMLSAAAGKYLPAVHKAERAAKLGGTGDFAPAVQESEEEAEEFEFRWESVGDGAEE